MLFLCITEIVLPAKVMHYKSNVLCNIITLYSNDKSNRLATNQGPWPLYRSSRDLSCSTIVLSRDHKGVGVAHKITSPKKQSQFSLTTMRQYWLGKTIVCSRSTEPSFLLITLVT